MAGENDATARAIGHFARLAKKGKHPGASSGEKQAYYLSKWLKRNMVSKVAGLDSQATEGFCALIKGASSCQYSLIEKILS